MDPTVIQQIIARKGQLQSEIAAAVAAFQTDTGIGVSGLDVTMLELSTVGGSRLYAVGDVRLGLAL